MHSVNENASPLQEISLIFDYEILCLIPSFFMFFFPLLKKKKRNEII